MRLTFSQPLHATALAVAVLAGLHSVFAGGTLASAATVPVSLENPSFERPSLANDPDGNTQAQVDIYGYTAQANTDGEIYLNGNGNPTFNAVDGAQYLAVIPFSGRRDVLPASVTQTTTSVGAGTYHFSALLGQAGDDLGSVSAGDPFAGAFASLILSDADTGTVLGEKDIFFSANDVSDPLNTDLFLPSNGFQSYTLDATVPADTTKLLLTLQTTPGPDSGTGLTQTPTLYADALSLTATTPEPAAMSLLAVLGTAGLLRRRRAIV